MAVDPEAKKSLQMDYKMNGGTAKELGEKYGIPYQTAAWYVRCIKKDMKTETEEDIVEAGKVNIEAIEDVAELIQDYKNVPRVEKAKAKAVANSFTGLKKLEETSQQTAMSIYMKLQTYLDSETETTLKDLKDAATIVSTLHTAMFSKNITQVNVVNNTTVSSEKRDIFKKTLGV